MNRTATFLCFLFGVLVSTSNVCAQAPQPAREIAVVLDSMINLLKEKSLYSPRVNWDNVRQQAHVLAAGKENIEQAREAFQFIFSSLQDTHGMLQIGQHAFRVPGNGAPVQDSIIVKELYKGPRIVVKRWGNMGYVRIPHMPMVTQQQIDRYANMLNDSICRMSSGVKAWIVDLRMNAGGNFRPMVAGIASLLCDGIWGSFIDYHGGVSGVFELRDGQLYLDGKQEAWVTKSCERTCAVPMAVLLGTSTGSSGEVAAVALSGRENTTFFGQPTFGFTNSTQGFFLANKQVYLLITTAQLRNRKGKVFDSRVLPDFSFDYPFQLDLEKDQLINEARNWLSGRMN